MVQPYEFRTLSPKMLVHLPHRFLRQTIAAQAQLRQFEVVDSKDFYFLIGNSHEYGQSQFSFRRFLHEDQPSGTQFLYLSHSVVRYFWPVKSKVKTPKLKHRSPMSYGVFS
jgi:hypothetical protein